METNFVPSNTAMEKNNLTIPANLTNRESNIQGFSDYSPLDRNEEELVNSLSYKQKRDGDASPSFTVQKINGFTVPPPTNLMTTNQSKSNDKGKTSSKEGFLQVIFYFKFTVEAA